MEKDPFLAFLYDQVSDQKKIFDVLKVLFVHKINREALESQCFQGIPDECIGLRSLCWKILLRYLPEGTHGWKSSLESSRKQYENHIQAYFVPYFAAASPTKKKETKSSYSFGKTSGTSSTNVEESKRSDFGKAMIEPDEDDHPLSTEKDSKWHTFFKDQKLWEDIIKDTKRTRSNTAFFQGYTECPLQKIYSRPLPFEKTEKETHIDVLSRMLFIYAKVNPGMGYMQGMNEVLAPIYYCFYKDLSPMFIGRAEADAYYCFSNLMKEIQDGFVKRLDNTEGGIHIKVKTLNELLKRIDKQLWTHLDKHKVNPQFYSLRWIMLLLAQEFSVDDVLKVWDRLFSHPKKTDYINYLCLAIIEGVRETLMGADDFATIMETLQRDVSNDLEKLFATAFRLYKQYSRPDEMANHLTLPQ